MNRRLNHAASDGLNQAVLNNHQLPSPVDILKGGPWEERGITFLVKRDDQIHPEVSGNKWRKLIPNLEEAARQGHHRIVTFGGAFSNHIAATAAAGKMFGFETVGLIRGERKLPLNPTLAKAVENGMLLFYLSREMFRQMHEPVFQTKIQAEYGPCYLLPMGGTNTLGISGCENAVQEIAQQLPKLPDYLCACCGTGGTFSGLVAGMQGRGKLLGFPALKGNFLQYDIQYLLHSYRNGHCSNWQLMQDYHFGGYAKYNDPLLAFIGQFKEQYGLLLDPIYTGKMFYGIVDLIQKGFFAEGSTILAVHSGGLQGILGFNERFGQSLPK